LPTPKKRRTAAGRTVWPLLLEICAVAFMAVCNGIALLHQLSFKSTIAESQARRPGFRQSGEWEPPD
jgi:hypothetical protein